MICQQLRAIEQRTGESQVGKGANHEKANIVDILRIHVTKKEITEIIGISCDDASDVVFVNGALFDTVRERKSSDKHSH